MDKLLNDLKKLLKQKKSNSWYAQKLGTTEKHIYELRGIIKKEKEYERIENKLFEEEEDYTNKTKKITHFSTHALSKEEIEEIADADNITTFVDRVWRKSHKNGTWTYSILVVHKPLSTENQLEIIKEELENWSPNITPYQYKKTGECLLEISIPDLHIGKLSWNGETGEDYDIKIAVERYEKAVEDLVSRVVLQSIDRILLPIGNDLLQINGNGNMTANGTPQDCDSRFHKMVKATKDLLIKTILRLSQIAPVDVLLVRGNHDADSSVTVAMILEAYFHNNPNVDVDASAHWRKYYQYFNNGFLYTHGDGERHNELGLIFATEQPQLWADTKYRVCKIGHYHKQKKMEWVSVDANQGFILQVLPSLSGTDNWHNQKGYNSLKQAKSFLYHKERGLIAEYTYTVQQ